MALIVCPARQAIFLGEVWDTAEHPFLLDVLAGILWI